MKTPWREGDWVAVPLLKNGGWAVGILARYKRPCIFGVFFSSRKESIPLLEDTENLRIEDSIFMALTGDMGLRRQSWVLIGNDPRFRREQWLLPEFYAQNASGYVLLTKNEDNVGETVKVRYVSELEAKQYPPASIYGHVALSIALERRIVSLKLDMGDGKPIHHPPLTATD